MGGLFSKVADAKIYEHGSYLGLGIHRVKITGCKTHASVKDSRVYAVIEMELLESTNHNLTIGGSYTQMIDMTNNMGPVNVKKFIGAFSGIEPDDREINAKISAFWTNATGRNLDVDKACELVFSGDDSPAVDFEMHVECVMTKTKKGNDFTLHNWRARRD